MVVNAHSSSTAQVVDKFEYLTFSIIGVSYLWPWNSFLSATSYFSQRLEGHALLSESLSSSLMLISTLSSTAIFIYLVGQQKNAKYSARVGYGELIIAVSFLVLAASCLLFTAVGAISYYLFLLLIMLVSTFGASYTQNGSFAIANLFGPIYTQAIMVGQAIAGIFPPIVSIFSAISATKASKLLAAQGKEIPKSSSISVPFFFSFLAPAIIALLALALFQLLIKQEPGRFHGDTDILPFPSSNGRRNGSQYRMITDDTEGTSSGVTAREDFPNIRDSSPTLVVSDGIEIEPVISRLQLFKKLQVPATTVFLVFAATLAFPVFLQAVKPVHDSHSSLLFVPEVFSPLALFIWNFGDFIGRLSCGRSKWVVTGDRTMLIYAVARFSFIPLYFMCNINGRGGLMKSDFIYMTIHFFFGFTNGHLGTSAMMQSVSYVNDHEKEQAGSFMTMMLSFGLTAGSLLSFILVAIVHKMS